MSKPATSAGPGEVVDSDESAEVAPPARRYEWRSDARVLRMKRALLPAVFWIRMWSRTVGRISTLKAYSSPRFHVICVHSHDLKNFPRKAAELAENPGVEGFTPSVARFYPSAALLSSSSCLPRHTGVCVRQHYALGTKLATGTSVRRAGLSYILSFFLSER